MAVDQEVQPPRDLVIQALNGVIASRALAGADRQKRFLQFIVEKTLDGQGGELKEYVLALEVFDRAASFDPRSDSIVRVEARKLRESLARYYEAEGKFDAAR